MLAWQTMMALRRKCCQPLIAAQISGEEFDEAAAFPLIPCIVRIRLDVSVTDLVAE